MTTSILEQQRAARATADKVKHGPRYASDVMPDSKVLIERRKKADAYDGLVGALQQIASDLGRENEPVAAGIAHRALVAVGEAE